MAVGHKVSYVALLNGETPSAGEVSFKGVYSGDNNNATSACEGQVTVSKTSPSLSTNPSSFNIGAGGSVTDTATLSEATSNAGGTVTYQLWSDDTCGASGGSNVQTYTVTVTGGAVPSVSFTINTPGSYSIEASYSGDSNNKGATSGCEGVITVT